MRYDYKDVKLLKPIYVYKVDGEPLCLLNYKIKETYKYKLLHTLSYLSDVNGLLLLENDPETLFHELLKYINFEKISSNSRSFKRFIKIYSDFFTAKTAIYNFNLYKDFKSK